MNTDVETELTIGSRIRDARVKKFLSQRELAEKTGVSLSLIGQLEKGARKPSPKTLYRLAEVLGVDAAWLEVGGENRAAGEDKYKAQWDNVLEFVNLLQDPKKARKFLNSYAQLHMALAGLTQALKDRQALDDGEIPSTAAELETLKKVEFHAKSCCDRFAELQAANPDGGEGIKKTFDDWQKEKQKFDRLLTEYNKLNATGRNIIIRSATSLAAEEAYRKESKLDTFKWASLCHKLKQLREEKHLSQQEVAESCGLQEGRIQEIEAAYSFPKPDELCRIADALEIRITELLPFSEEEEDRINRLYKERQKWLHEHKNEMDEAASEPVLSSIMVLLEEYVKSIATRINSKETLKQAKEYVTYREYVKVGG